MFGRALFMVLVCVGFVFDLFFTLVMPFYKPYLLLTVWLPTGLLLWWCAHRANRRSRLAREASQPAAAALAAEWRDIDEQRAEFRFHEHARRMYDLDTALGWNPHDV